MYPPDLELENSRSLQGYLANRIGQIPRLKGARWCSRVATLPESNQKGNNRYVFKAKTPNDPQGTTLHTHTHTHT
jgi:hypothetical protein